MPINPPTTIYLRKELAEHNKQLVETAKNAGVETQLDYAIFQNYGYKGLYNGMTAQDIFKKNIIKMRLFMVNLAS